MYDKYPLHFNSKLLACLQQTNKASTICRTTLHTTWSSQTVFLIFTYLLFVRCCRVEQEVVSNKAWEAKGTGSPKNNKSMRMNPSVIKTPLPLRATSNHQQRTCSYTSHLILRAKVVNNEHEGIKLAMGKTKNKPISSLSWLPKSMSIT
jgi:hypothetical protein